MNDNRLGVWCGLILLGWVFSFEGTPWVSVGPRGNNTQNGSNTTGGGAAATPSANAGSDCGLKPVKPNLGSNFDENLQLIWLQARSTPDLISSSCDLLVNPKVDRAYRAKDGNDFCVGFVIDCGNFYGFRVVYPPSDPMKVFGLMYAEEYDEVIGGKAVFFNFTQIGSDPPKIITTLDWIRSQDDSKQSSLINGENDTCTGPTTLKTTYTYEAEDPYYDEEHKFYKFPVKCTSAETGSWVLKHYFALEGPDGVEFQGYQEIDEYLFETPPQNGGGGGGSGSST